MALIVREEVKLECMNVGRKIESAVLNKKRALSDEQLEEIISPLVNNVTERIEHVSSKELDEYIGAEENKKEQYNKDDILNQRISTLSDRAIVYNKDTDTKFFVNTQIAKKLAKNLNIKLKKPKDNIDYIDYDDVVEYSTDDEYWDSYLPKLKYDDNDTVQNNISQKYIEIMLNGNSKDLIYFATENSDNIDHLLRILKLIQKEGIYPYSFHLEYMVDTVQAIIDNNLLSSKKRKISKISK